MSIHTFIHTYITESRGTVTADIPHSPDGVSPSLHKRVSTYIRGLRDPPLPFRIGIGHAGASTGFKCAVFCLRGAPEEESFGMGSTLGGKT